MLVHCVLRRHCGLKVERSGTGRRQWRRRGFRGRRSVAKAAVGSDRVVVSPPGFDQHFCLGEAVEDLTIEQFIAKRPVEAFVVAILPGRSRRSKNGSVKSPTRVGQIARNAKPPRPFALFSVKASSTQEQGRSSKPLSPPRSTGPATGRRTCLKACWRASLRKW